METTSTGYYNISSGNVGVNLEAINTVDDYATLKLEDRETNAYKSLEKPHLNANLGESLNERKDTKPRKVRNTMTPTRWICMGVFTAVIVILVISVGINVFLFVSSKSEDIDDCISTNCGNGTCACTSEFAGKNCERNRKLLPTDCYDLYHFAGVKADGVYTIVTWKTQQSIQVYCDMTTYGGGWTVFQYRFNGSVIFYRDFAEYEHGFGDLNTEFWLGLNYTQEISSQGQTDLRIDLESANGTTAFETFENFHLSPNPEFALLLGKTTDSLHISDSNRIGPYHNGMHFSTFDKDVDPHSSNCAKMRGGGWWYKSCSTGTLNGHYIKPGLDVRDCMNYYSFLGYTSLKKAK